MIRDMTMTTWVRSKYSGSKRVYGYSTKLPEGVGRGKRGKLLFDNWKNYKIKQKCTFSFSTFFFFTFKRNNDEV